MRVVWYARFNSDAHESYEGGSRQYSPISDTIPRFYLGQPHPPNTIILYCLYRSRASSYTGPSLKLSRHLYLCNGNTKPIYSGLDERLDYFDAAYISGTARSVNHQNIKRQTVRAPRIQSVFIFATNTDFKRALDKWWCSNELPLWR